MGGKRKLNGPENVRGFSLQIVRKVRDVYSGNFSIYLIDLCEKTTDSSLQNAKSKSKLQLFEH